MAARVDAGSGGGMGRVLSAGFGSTAGSKCGFPAGGGGEAGGGVAGRGNCRMGTLISGNLGWVDLTLNSTGWPCGNLESRGEREQCIEVAARLQFFDLHVRLLWQLTAGSDKAMGLVVAF